MSDNDTAETKLTTRHVAMNAGMLVARQAFKKRGNHSEIHLSEGELAAMIGFGVEAALKALGIDLNERP